MEISLSRCRQAMKKIDFLLSAKRDTKAARRFLNKAIGSSGKLSLINIDKSGANAAAIKQYNFDENKRVKIRQCKYLNNIVEQDQSIANCPMYLLVPTQKHSDTTACRRVTGR